MGDETQTFYSGDLGGDFEQKFYQRNTSTELSLYDGTQLLDGMLVLIANPDFRVEISEQMSVKEVYSAYMFNRWCRVSNLQIFGGLVSFLATYADGYKARRVYPLGEAWLARKDSVEYARKLKVTKPGPKPDVATESVDPVQRVKSKKTFAELVTEEQAAEQTDVQKFDTAMGDDLI